jgi:prefoldin subunit 5
MSVDLSKNNSNQEAQGTEQQLLPKDFQTIIAGIFPNTRYFDSRFDLIQVQIDELRRGQDSIKEEMKFRFADVDRRFGEMERRFVEMGRSVDEFKVDVGKRFELVDKRFEQVDKRIDEFKQSVDRRFEQADKRIDEFKRSVDKRFEQVDKRFEQIIASIDRLADKLDHRDRDQRGFTLRMFSISIAISILGALGAFLKVMGVF